MPRNNEPGTGPDPNAAGDPAGNPEGTPPTDPGTGSGHAEPQGSAGAGTPPAGTPDPDGEALFDRKAYQELLGKLDSGNISGEEVAELKDQIIALEKGITGAFTKKSQGISDLRKKAEMVDEFQRQAQANPAAALAGLARNFGVTPEQMAQALNGSSQGSGSFSPREEYNSVNEVFEDVAKMIETTLDSRLKEALKPVMSRVQEMNVQSVEATLNAIDPDWRIYEDSMTEMAEKFPDLMKDPAALYRLSVPQEVQEKRAVKAAMDRLQKQTKSASVGGTGTSASTRTPPGKAGSFREAAQGAIDQLKKEGRLYT